MLCPMMMHRALAVVEIIFHGLNKSPSAYDFFNTQQTRNFFKKRTIDIYDSSVFDQRRGVIIVGNRKRRNWAMNWTLNIERDGRIAK